MNYTIVKETNKALLLNSSNIDFWVQKRWLRKDGTLTPSGLESFEKVKEAQARKIDFEKNGGFRLWVKERPSYSDSLHRMISKGYARLYHSPGKEDGEAKYAHVFFDDKARRDADGVQVYTAKLVNYDIDFGTALEGLAWLRGGLADVLIEPSSIIFSNLGYYERNGQILKIKKQPGA